jgi:hypothetical protein
MQCGGTVNRKYRGTPPGGRSCKTDARTDMWNGIFAIGFETRLMGTELNRETFRLVQKC